METPRQNLDLAAVDHALLDARSFVGAISTALGDLRPDHGKEAIDALLQTLEEAEGAVEAVLEQETPGEGW